MMHICMNDTKRTNDVVIHTQHHAESHRHKQGGNKEHSPNEGG